MKKTIMDYDVSGKKVIVRCDYNVPIKDGIIEDDTRIKASLKTLRYLIDHKAKVIILSHLGKVKTLADKEANSLYPVSKRLGELLNLNVYFCPDTSHGKLDKMVNDLACGEVLMVENTRYEDIIGKKESICDLNLAKYWASLGDIFINDAYGMLHRAHASNVGIANYLPSGIGFLVLEEISKIDEILNENTHPLVVIMGGKKVVDKIKVIENLITKCDKLLIGGAMAYTFLYAKGYKVGASFIDNESVDFCKNLLSRYEDKIVLPVDFNVGQNCRIEDFKDDDIGYDIGCETISKFQNNLKGAKRVIMNGPLGVFEDSKYALGTIKILEYLKENNIKTLLGGGDTAYAVNKLSFDNDFYHVSTGGGATLEYLEGKELPGLKVISEK